MSNNRIFISILMAILTICLLGSAYIHYTSFNVVNELYVKERNSIRSHDRFSLAIRSSQFYMANFLSSNNEEDIDSAFNWLEVAYPFLTNMDKKSISTQFEKDIDFIYSQYEKLNSNGNSYSQADLIPLFEKITEIVKISASEEAKIQLRVGEQLKIIHGKYINSSFMAAIIGIICLFVFYFFFRLIKSNEDRLANLTNTQTKLLEARKELEQAKLENINSHYVEKVGRIIGELSHEVMNPLAIIEGAADLCKKTATEVGDPEKISKQTLRYMSMIDRNSVRITGLLKSLKTLSYMGVGKNAEILSLNDSVKEMSILLSRKTKQFKFEIEMIAEQKVSAFISKEDMSQILLHLLSNSIDSVCGPESADIVKEKWIKVYLEENDEGSKLKIVDSGKISEKISEKEMFDLFRSTKGDENIGLGLSLAAALVKKNGGKLYLDSTDPTTFILEFPNVMRGSEINNSQTSKAS